ncbi:transaldolase [Propionibacteriaceae bacterium Y1923]|uniref:transaldolase n=1 Tax=Aestuariimicrobium sp. Y1814 TaxID=3418742 RepID=UPI003C1F6258
MTANPRTAALSQAGVSIWLDDLSRERLNSGNLADLIERLSVVGVTTNPTIFAKALGDGASYGEQLRATADQGVEGVIRELTTTDVRNACDLFTDIHTASQGFDGRVSIEVDPRLAMDEEGTVAQAAELYEKVGRANVLIKIPATKPGLSAIRRTIAAGISVNVTLIFSNERYGEVIDAYLSGLEDAAAAGIDLSGIHSVASVFVSRIDTEVDKRLDAIGGEEAAALRSQVAIANTRLAYQLYEQEFGGERFAALAAKGANRQRPLWASTGVKDPALPDTRYVDELVAGGVVNTMPENTLQAVADHGSESPSDQVTTNYEQAAEVIARTKALGIDFDDVFAVLESEGVEKFEQSWNDLLESTQAELDKL